LLCFSYRVRDDLTCRLLPFRTCFHRSIGRMHAWWCLDMIWVLLIMHLASHGTQSEETMQFVSHCDNAEVSDSHPLVSEKPIEHLVSCEINPVSVDGDNENSDANEETRLVIEDVPQCRICLDNEGPHHDLYCFLQFLRDLIYLVISHFISYQLQVGDNLIAPCRCKGTQKYVHRSCLDNWRSTKVWILEHMLCCFTLHVCRHCCS
jgi:hypothetical protein